MALMAFGSSFSAQMTAFQQARLSMTPQQVRAESARMQASRIMDINLARRALGSRVAAPAARPLVRPAPVPLHMPAALSNVGTLTQPLLTPVTAQEGPVGFLSGLGKVFGGIGTAISDVRGITSTIGAAIHPAATAAGKAATIAVDTAKAGARTVAAHPVLAASAAAAGIAAGAGTMGAMGGGTSAAKAHVKRVKQALGLHHKRMHVTNTKALHRALRRVKGFERVARRVMQITHHRPVKMHFKFGRRKRAA
jgi:hypothetical protein